MSAWRGHEGPAPPDPTRQFGPPEKCYYRHVSDHPALLLNTHGKGSAACFAFEIGSHYARQAHQGHAALLVGAIDGLLAPDRRVQVTGPSLVKINHRANPKGRFESVSLYNHSGQRGIALHAPIPITPVEISLKTPKPVRAISRLASGRELPFDRQADGRVTLTLPRMELFEIVVFQFGS